MVLHPVIAKTRVSKAANKKIRESIKQGISGNMARSRRDASEGLSA
jgi:hypothetical protein